VENINLKHKGLHLAGLVLLMVGILFLSSCQADDENPENKYAGNGINLCKKAQLLITEIDTWDSELSYQDELIKILNDASPETYQMKMLGNSGDFHMRSLYFSNALKKLEKVYIAFELQLDSRVSSSTAGLHEKMLLASMALDSLEMGDALKLKNNNLKKNLGSGKYRTDASLFQLTDMYAQVWDLICSEHQKVQLNAVANYESGIKRTPVSAFSAEKIKTLINEPYSNNAVLVNLYKLKLIKDNQQKVAGLSERINKVSDAFNRILQVQGELLKRKKDMLKIQELNNTITVLLSN
jgi:hypothetical protein